MQLNKLIEFRQQIYDHALTKARDAQFELIDAVLSNRRIASFPELTLAAVHSQPVVTSDLAAIRLLKLQP